MKCVFLCQWGSEVADAGRGTGAGGQVFMAGSEAVMRIRKIKVGSVWRDTNPDPGHIHIQ